MEKRKGIKRLFGMALLGIMCVGSCLQITTKTVTAEPGWPSGIDVESECAIIMEANTGAILYEKNVHEQCYPASITKIMTTMLVLENSSLDETVTFSKDAVYNTEGSGIYRNVDEQMSMKDCLYAVMLESANECAYAAAEHVTDGDYQKFVQMMNDKAQALGCTDTHFSNCNGLPDETHVTSCYDMALISREAIKNNMFRTIISTSRYDLPATNKSEPLAMFNHHRMICANRGTKYLYDYAIGGKTGFTNAARNTLVTYAEKDGMMLICVLMKSGAVCQWTDTQRLFDYCFENFAVYNVANNENRFSDGISDMGSLSAETEPFAKLDQDAMIVLPASAAFADTQTEVNYDNVSDHILGTLIYKYADHTVGTANVVMTGAKVDPYKFTEGNTYTAESDDSDAKEKKSKNLDIDKGLVIKIIVICVVAAVVIYLIIKWLSRRHSQGWKEMQRPDRDYVRIRERQRGRRRRRP